MLAEDQFQLTPQQRRFKAMLSRYPLMLRYWDFNQHTVDLLAINKETKDLTRNHQIMLSFFLDVWTGSAESDFSLLEAADTLEPQSRQVIIDWFSDPFYP